jgi:hypothetical protein
MHTDETDDLGDAPPMPPEGTRVHIREDEAAAVARQTLDSEPRDAAMIGMLSDRISGREGVVMRSAHTNGTIKITPRAEWPIHLAAEVFAYGAQVEPVTEDE